MTYTITAVGCLRQAEVREANLREARLREAQDTTSLKPTISENYQVTQPKESLVQRVTLAAQDSDLYSHYTVLYTHAVCISLL